MCGPAAVPVAMAVGTAAQLYGSARSASEQRDYVARQEAARRQKATAEMARQQDFRDQGAQTFSDVLGVSGAPQYEAAQDTAADRRFERLAPTDDFAAVESVMSADAPRVVRTALAKEMREQLARGREQAKARARIEAGGDVDFGRSLVLARSGQRLGTLSSLSQGSLRLLPSEQQGAAAGVRPPSGIGDLLAGTGSLGFNYGLSKLPHKPAPGAT